MIKIHEIENVLNTFELKNIYKQLMDNGWTINSAYGEDTHTNFYPMLRVSFEDSVYLSLIHI